jgi:glycosyltransferase involved in cell wall biosynthesis
MNSLVIPVYKNEANLDRLLAELLKLASRIPGDLEVVFVVDGSPDRCLQILRERLPALPLRYPVALAQQEFRFLRRHRGRPLSRAEPLRSA